MPLGASPLSVLVLSPLCPGNSPLGNSPASACPEASEDPDGGEGGEPALGEEALPELGLLLELELLELLLELLELLLELLELGLGGGELGGVGGCGVVGLLALGQPLRTRQAITSELATMAVLPL
jgi:hypothetical protein